MRPKAPLAAALLTVGLLVRDSAAGQTSEQSQRLPSPRDYGVGNANILQIPASAFAPTSSGVGWNFDAVSGDLWASSNSSGANVVFWAPVTLPTGSVISYVDLYSYDNNATYDLFVNLVAYSGYSTPTSATIGSCQTSGAPGHAYNYSVPFSYTVNNDVRYGGGAQLAVLVTIPLLGVDSNLRFKAVDIWWTRQISPAPATATFADVPTTHPFFRVIEALAASGITTGCGGNNFCPNGTVTRQEVAKFIVRALGLYQQDGALP